MTPAEPPGTDRVLTIPNILSFLRIAAIPVFVWLIVDEDTTFIGLIVFGVVLATDWIDGAIARATNQVSELGKLLDPVSDRLAIAAGLVALVVRGAFPLWAALLILVRDACVVLAGVVLLAGRGARIEVRYLGKVATFSLVLAIAAIAWGNLDYALAPAFLAFGCGRLRGRDRRVLRGHGPLRRRSSGRHLHEASTASCFRPGCDVEGEAGMEFPEDLRYTKEHEWIRDEGDGRTGSASPTTPRTPSGTSCTSTCHRRHLGERGPAAQRGRVDEVGLGRLRPRARDGERAEPAPRGAPRAR